MLHKSNMERNDIEVCKPATANRLLQTWVTYQLEEERGWGTALRKQREPKCETYFLLNILITEKNSLKCESRAEETLSG